MLNRALYLLVVSCSLQPVLLFAQQEKEKGQAVEVPDQVTMDTEGTRGMNMALSPDGKTAAVNLTNGSILLCDARTGEVRSVLTGHQQWTWLTFSPDSKQLASGGSQDGQVRLWDVAAGRQIVQLTGHDTQVSMVDFSPDGKWLASSGFVLSDTDRDGEIKIWDIKTGRELFTLAADNGLTDIKFSPDGKYLVSAEYAKKRIDLGSMSEVKIWDLKTRKIVKRIPNVCGLMSRLRFSPNGKTLAIGEYNGPVIHAASHRVQFVDTKNWDFQGALVGHTNRIFGLDFTPNGNTVVTSSSDGTLRVWDVKTRKLQKLVPTNTGNTSQLSLSKDGSRFSFASKAAEVIRLGALKHDAKYLTGKMKSKSLESIGAVRFSSDGKNLAVSRRRKAVYWDATTGTGLPPLSYFKQTPRAFSPDLRYAVTAYRIIEIWDITTGKVVTSMQSASSGTYTPVFSADGRLLAAGAPNGAIKLWEAKSGKLWSASPKQKINYPYLAFSPDGRLLAAGAYERQGGIVLWEVPPANAKAAEANAVEDPKPVKTPEKVTEAYKQAQQFVTNKQSTTENLQKALSPVASLLPAIVPQTGSVPVKWHRLRVNADGSGFYAVRLRSNLMKNADLQWAFVYPKNLKSWYITPVEGTITGFKNFQYEDNISLEGVSDSNGSRTVFQVLNGGVLQPKKDYLLWFSFSDDKPANLNLCLHLSPAGKHAKSVTSTEIAAAIGIKTPLKYHTVTDIPLKPGKRLQHGSFLVNLVYSPDGKMLASAGSDRTVKIWDLATGKVNAAIRGRTAAFSPDGRYIVTAGPTDDPRFVILWDAKTGARLKQFDGAHLREVQYLSFSPDGTRVASGCAGGVVALWNLETGKQDWSAFEFD